MKVRSRLGSVLLLCVGFGLGYLAALAGDGQLLRTSAASQVAGRMGVDGAHLREALATLDANAQGAVASARRGTNTGAGVALAQAIRFSREQARRAGVRPVPPELRARLAPYFPAETLDEVRWTVAGRRLSLGTVLAGWYYREGAVTLGDTVVFSTEETARDLRLWAHELTHARQYEELGVDGFARLYVARWSAVERQAASNGRDVAALIEGQKTADAGRRVR